MDPALAPYVVWGVVLLVFLVAVVSMFGKRADGEYRGSSLPGAGAYGAVYGLLNEDKRNAVEIIVEEKAGARDSEHADDTVT
jgi:hypothetical protein